MEKEVCHIVSTIKTFYIFIAIKKICNIDEHYYYILRLFTKNMTRVRQ